MDRVAEYLVIGDLHLSEKTELDALSRENEMISTNFSLVTIAAPHVDIDYGVPAEF